MSKPRSGRPPKLTDREKRDVLKTVRLKPGLTASQIAQDIKHMFNKELHHDTIMKILKNNHLHGRTARKKPLISPVNKKKRLVFAKKFIQEPATFWNNVLFSDESKFCIFGIKGRKLVWRKSGTAFDVQNLAPTVKHGGGGVMVWGCMAANGVGNLIFIDSIIDHKAYLQILKDNLQESREKLGLADDFWFQHDNDPKHTAHNERLWLLYNLKNQLHSPPQSPELNPIEHLWDCLELRIRQRTITSKNMLKEVIMEEWHNISPDVTQKLVQSMLKRLVETIKRKGYPTSYSF